MARCGRRARPGAARQPPVFVLYSTRIVDWQLWLYILSTLALAGCLILTGLNAFPQELRRLAPFAARWDPGRVLAWTFALFVLGLVITAAGGIAAAVDALGNHRFGQ